MTAVNLRNVLVLLGIIITTVALIYFGVQFGDIISEWGRTIALAALAVGFVALGLHMETTVDETALIGKSGWRWLKVTNALYILGSVGALATVISFLTIDQIDRIWRVLILLAVGVGLILYAARWVGEERPQNESR